MPHKLMEMVHKGTDTYSALVLHPELKNKFSTQVIIRIRNNSYTFVGYITTHSLDATLRPVP